MVEQISAGPFEDRPVHPAVAVKVGELRMASGAVQLRHAPGNSGRTTAASRGFIRVVHLGVVYSSAVGFFCRAGYISSHQSRCPYMKPR